MKEKKKTNRVHNGKTNSFGPTIWRLLAICKKGHSQGTWNDEWKMEKAKIKLLRTSLSKQKNIPPKSVRGEGVLGGEGWGYGEGGMRFSSG